MTKTKLQLLVAALALVGTISQAQVNQGEVTLNTIADLDLTYPIYRNGVAQTAAVRGFYTAGDWGAAKLFRYDSTNALSTNAIRRASRNGVGRWVHDWADGDIRAFGAKPDSSTDNTAAYALAVAEAKSRNGGYTLYFPPGAYVGYLDLTYRVNVKGANAGRFSEFTALAPTNQTFVAGLSQLILPAGANRPLILITNDGSGYIRQPDKVWSDGSVYTSVYGGNSISDIILNGNGGNQSSNNCDLIRMTGFWGITVENVGLFNNRGYAIRAQAINACRFSKLFGFAANAPTPSKGIYIGTAADNIFSEWWIGGYDGPVLWIRGSDHWKNQSSDLMLFNSGSAGSQTNRWAIAVDSGTDVVTTTGSHYLETGDPVEFYTDGGTLPAGVVSTNTYHAVKQSATTFKVARAYTHAVAGTNLVDFTTTGSGTNYAWIGPMAGFYASDQARRNTYANIRVDQNYTDGFVLNNAHRLVFSSLFAGENDFNNSANNSYGMRILGNSQGNTVSGFVIYTTPGGVQFQDDSQENTVLSAAIDTDVTTRWAVADENDKNFYQEARSLWIGDYARVGNSNQTTALDVVGNASGIRVLRLIRPSAGATNTIGTALNQIILYNDVGANQGRIALFEGGTNYTTLSFTKALSTNDPARQLTITAGAATGTNKNGATVFLQAAAGTGSGTNGAFEFQTPITTSSGTNAQSLQTVVKIGQAGNIKLLELPSAPLTDVTNSYFYGIIGGVTNWYFFRNGAWVGLP